MKSVSGLTMTWPRIPCGRAIRPTSRRSSLTTSSSVCLETATCVRSWRVLETSPPGSRFVVAELQHRLGSFELGGGAHERSHRRGGSPLTADHASQVAGGHEEFHKRLPLVLTLGHADRLGPIRERTGHDLNDVAAAAHDAGCSAFAKAPSDTSAVANASSAGGAGGIRATSVRTVSDGTAPAFTQCSSRSRFNWSVSGFVLGL